MTTLRDIGLVHYMHGELEQALPIRRAVGDRAGEATTLDKIDMTHRNHGELAAAVAAFERVVGPEELVGHPDLESHRRVLEQVGYERDAETT